MHDDVKKAYHFASWPRRTRHGGGLLVRNFAPWVKDFGPLEQSAKELFVEAPDRRLTRTVWDDPADPPGRVLVDLREAASFEGAQRSLLEVLANNQLARLPEGPADLGDVAFVHPEGMPPAAFWVIGNLCVSVCNFGRKPMSILGWADRLQSRILDRPEGGKLGMAFEPGKSTARVGQPVTLRITLGKGQSPDSCVKVFVSGADLFLNGDGVTVRPKEKGKLTIEAYAVEPGRKATAGRIALTVK